MRLCFIGGASGSGKTAVMPHLKELLGDRIAVYDFDDIGVPEGADKKWRGESTEKWLQKLLIDGKDACFDSNPESVQISKMEVTNKTILKIKLAKGGGQAIRFIAEN